MRVYKYMVLEITTVSNKCATKIDIGCASNLARKKVKYALFHVGSGAYNTLTPLLARTISYSEKYTFLSISKC
jgi:hypothetical protein